MSVTVEKADQGASDRRAESRQDDYRARPSEPEIVENYRDYVPSFDIKKTIRDLLTAVPAAYLVGLKTIVLANRSSLTRDQRRQKIWQRGRKHQVAASLGAYYKATRSQPACVWLFADNIVQTMPSWGARVPMLRYAAVGSVLYHEIGHHIHRVHRPVYDGRENVAEDWEQKLGRAFLRKRYWYLIPVFPVLRVASKAAAAIVTKKPQAGGSRFANKDGNS